jgi:hypothetical protein
MRFARNRSMPHAGGAARPVQSPCDLRGPARAALLFCAALACLGRPVSAQPPAPKPPTIALQSYGGTPTMRVHRRPRAVLDHMGRNKALAAEVMRLINDPAAMERELSAVPFGRFDVSPEGTRSLTVTSPKFPGLILRFTGIGVVKGALRGGKPHLEVEAPDPSTALNSKSHMQAMGSTYVADDGSVWGVGNDSPFGAYDLPDLERKVANTKAFARAEDIELVAAGHFEASRWGWRKPAAMGWMVYAMPADVVTPEEVYRTDPTIYGSVLRALGQRLRENHARGEVHLQMHPGNWFVRYDGAAPRPVISDWSTACQTSRLPSADKICHKPRPHRITHWEKYMAALSPAQRACALDLERAMSASGAPEHEGRVLGGLGLTEDQIAKRLRAGLEMVLGYHGWKLTDRQHAAMLSNLTAAYRALALDQLFAGGGGEAGIKTYEDLNGAHFGGYAQRGAIDEVFRRLARASVREPGGAALRQNLLAGAALISAPTEYFLR